MSENVSRRSFVKAAAISVAPAVLPALAQSDQVPVGIIGVGSRGNYLLTRLWEGSGPLVRVLAVADTYEGWRNRAKDKIASTWKTTPTLHVDYNEVLANPDISTVIIATPEHLHQSMTLAALKAGKNIYVEKPLAHTIEEGEEVLKAVAASKVKVQVGTQNRSNSLYNMARQMIRQGLIGECHYVRAFWYRNALANGVAAWRYTIPAESTPQNTDWNRFLGPAQQRPFNKNRYFQWRLYEDYSGGISTDLLVHQTDITNFVMDKVVPTSCMASGGIYRWFEDDDRDMPDTLTAVYEYPNRFHVNYSCYFGNDNFGYGEQFLGDEGTIEVLNRQILHFTPQTFGGAPPPAIAARLAGRKEARIELPNNDNYAVEAHLRNLVEAVQGKAELVAPVTIGQYAAISGHMATLSWRNKKMIVWDDKARKYSFV